MDDSFCVKSRTVIMVANCCIMWQSKLQSETAPLTMEIEIIALGHGFCELFPIIDGVSIMGKANGLHDDNVESTKGITCFPTSLFLGILTMDIPLIGYCLLPFCRL